jgi:hypothetical protein
VALRILDFGNHQYSRIQPAHRRGRLDRVLRRYLANGRDIPHQHLRFAGASETRR